MFAGDAPLHVWGADHLRLAVDAACVALWSWNLADDRFAMDERAFDLWGLPWSRSVSFEDMSAHIHPADRDRVQAAFAATRSVPGSYEIDFRIMIGPDIRWISARGKAPSLAEADTPMFGIFLDVTGRKQAEEGNELLAGEMSHRVKNLLAIAAGLTQLTSRSAATVEQMTGELTERLTSLGRAHDLVRPLPGSRGKLRYWAIFLLYCCRHTTILGLLRAAFGSPCRGWGSARRRRPLSPWWYTN